MHMRGSWEARAVQLTRLCSGQRGEMGLGALEASPVHVPALPRDPWASVPGVPCAGGPREPEDEGAATK